MTSGNTPQATPNTISLADEAGVREVLARTILGMWDLVDGLTCLKPSTNDRYRVTIFGSARVGAETASYAEVKRIAEALASLKCEIITGGGPGLMQAANEGAVGGGGGNVGIRVELPFEQDVNPFVQQAFEHKTFFTRLHHFVLVSDAFVVVPGGIGTVLELMMVWQLLQVRHLHGTPLILVGDMWSELVDWARKSLMEAHPPLVSPKDLEIPRCVASADEAIELIRTHHAGWLSRQGRQE